MITVHRRWRRLLLAAYLALVLTLTHLPPEIIDQSPIDLWDKLEHVLAYAGLGFLAIWAGDFHPGRRGLRLLLLTGVALAILAAVDESTQPFFMRSCELHDWYADLIGIAAGSLIAAVFAISVQRWRRQ